MCSGDKPRLLIVDDDPACARVIGELAREAGYEVKLADDGEAALGLWEEFGPDAVVSDVRMPGVDGRDLLRALRARDPALPVILISAHADIPVAVEAMQAGAVDYVAKPVEWEQLQERLLEALEQRALLDEDAELRRRIGIGLVGLLGTSTPMCHLYEEIRRVAASRATVLVTGESGTGKGEVARAIHELGPRRDAPFVTLHCAAVSPKLVESELFGHERGAFTGAVEQRIGRFERANGGTLFIDEVAEISGPVQTKLLRVLQERRFERVGGNEPMEVDVRLIAATNRDLEKRVADGAFREDLYYRLNVVTLELPPLRERDGDVLLLAQYFLEQAARKNERRVEQFTQAARDKLLGYGWPGNVRELQNAVERGVVMSKTRLVDASDLPDFEKPRSRVVVPGATLKELELEAIRATFAATGGSTKRTAEVLGLSQRTIQYRLRDLGLSKSPGRPRKRKKAK